MRHLLHRLVPALALAGLAACYSGFHHGADAYSDLFDHQAVLLGSSSLPTDMDVGGTSYDWRQGPNGYYRTMSCPAELELDPADLEAYVADLDAYLREDVFGSGFYLVEEQCSIETRTTTPSLSQRAKLELGWESASSSGTMVVTLSDGARTGLYDLYLQIDEEGG